MTPNILSELCLEIVSSCPMKCIHCSNDHNLQNKLEFSEITSIIDDFSNLGGKILEISGGEPLEHNDLLSVIRYAKTKLPEVRLYTSGLASQSGDVVSISNDMANSLKKSGLDRIIFNVEGSKSKTHELITGLIGSYDKVIKSIKTTIASGLWSGIHFVPTKLNFKEVEQAIEISKSLEVSEFALLRFVPQGRGLPNRETLELSEMEYQELFNNLNKLKTDSIVRIGHPLNCFIYDDEISKCIAGKSLCLIKTNGEVVPCPAFKQNVDYVAGNIKNSSLIDIWSNSDVFKKFRAFNYENLIACKNCTSLLECKGGCTAQRIINWGDLHRGKDPICSKIVLEAYTPFTKVLSSSDTAVREQL